MAVVLPLVVRSYITESSGVLSSSLAGDYITSGVTVDLQGLTANSQGVPPVLTINLATGTGGTHTTQVVINGTEEFTASPSGPLSNSGLNITTNDPSGTALVIGSGGTLSSDGSLSVAANGNITSAGGTMVADTMTISTTNGGSVGSLSVPVYTAPHTSGGTVNMTVNTAGSVYVYNTGSLNLGQSTGDTFVVQVVNGNLSTSGTITGNNITLDPRGGFGGGGHGGFGGWGGGHTNKAITLGADVIGNDSVTLVADLAGDIEQTAGTISTPDLSIISGSGNVGSTSASIQTNASYLNVNTTGNVYVNDTGAVALDDTTSSGNTFNLTAAGTITVNYSVTATNLLLQATANNGGIALNAGVTGSTSATLTANGSGSITQTAGTITSGALALSTGTGNIGTDPTAGGAAINTAVSGTLSANTSTTGSGTVFIVQSGGVTLNNSTAGGNFSLTVTGSGSTTVNSITTGNGSITVDTSSTSSALNVAPGATVYANEGNITLENDNTTSGTIAIGSGAVVSANTAGSVLGNVYIVLGAAPAIPVAGMTPPNTVANPTYGGTIYFGTNGISDTTPTNYVNANGGTVVFNTGSAAGSNISLGGGATVDANAAPVTPGGPLNSLDLTNPSVTNLIDTLIVEYPALISGSLTLNSSGVATGGAITIAPGILAHILVGENIPANVTVDLSGFTSGNPMRFLLTSASYTTQAIISGTVDFTGGGTGVENILSNQAGPVLLINNIGLLSSDGGLTMTANGDMSINGAVTAATSLTLQTTGNNGNIMIGANLAGPTSVTLVTQGSGNITRTATLATTGIVSGGVASFSTGTGSIGTSKSNILTTVTTLQAHTGGSGNAFFTQNGAVNLGLSNVAGQLQLLANNTITTTGAVTAGLLTLKTTANNGNIVIGTNVTGTTGAYLTTQGTGVMTVNAGCTLASISGPTFVTAYDVNITGNIDSKGKRRSCSRIQIWKI